MAEESDPRYSDLEYHDRSDQLPTVVAPRAQRGNYIEQLRRGGSQHAEPSSASSRRPDPYTTRYLNAGTGDTNKQIAHSPAGNTNKETVLSEHGYMYQGDEIQEVPNVRNVRNNEEAADKEERIVPLAAPSQDETMEIPPEPTMAGMKPRTFWIIVGVIVAVIVLAAVLGGALGATVGKHSSNSSPAPAPSSSATSTMSGFGATKTTAPFSYTGLQKGSHLAALSFNDAAGGLQYAVYYQDEYNYIKQSYFNSSLNTWNVSNVPQSRGAKPGGGFAAAVVTGTGTYQIELFYLNSSNIIQELWLAQDSAEWKSGYATAQNYVAHPNSSLALVWDACDGCTGDLLWFWQDPAMDIRIGNSTSAVGLVDDAIESDALGGSGLAVIPLTVPNEPLVSLR